ncbi:DUF2177 family protein [Microvirga sp. W0021]|uniref:DUF2177 family protein n=1 Tax=Hohaiivirga grylli TaxID=3133970 RepID=A0ABV0BI79_9HYPH
MKYYLFIYLSTFIIFLAIDMIWLGFVARDYYQTQLGSLLLDKPRLLWAAAFYLLYAVGIVIFCITPSLKDNSWQHALIMGALFGFIAYATYDLTNLATLKSWSVNLSLVDMIWGAFLTGITSLSVYGLVSFLFGAK